MVDTDWISRCDCTRPSHRMTSMSMPIRARIALMTMLVLAASLQAAAWPTFRKDNARSGITDETLSLPLTASWVFSQRFVPEPAFGLGYPFGTNWEGGVEKRRIDFDRADSAVIAGGKVYFGSVGDGKVYCVDAATGKVVWTFLTGGPVRLAPSVVGGKVYFGSDDGYVYCIGAADGKEVWRLRAAPADHHVVGNGSLVSLWPVRTGVVVDGGIAYFGTGIFAAEGVFIYAVDAATGKVLWRNDQGCEERMGQICPMGYPLVTASRLVIPMSRLAPAVYDRKTGSKLTRLSIYYGGGTFGTMYRSLLFTGWESAHCFDVDKDLAIQGGTSQSVASFPGGQLVATGKAVYSCGLPRAGGVSNAVQAYTWEIPDKIPGQTDIKRGQAKPLGKPAKWWSAKVAEPEAIILAGKHLIVGRPGEVLALGTEDGKTVWSANVDGVAKSLAVADGRLYVSTDTGKLYCFAAAGTKKIGHVAQGIDAPTISPAIKAAADTIVKKRRMRRRALPWSTVWRPVNWRWSWRGVRR